jgi:putative ABC transport system permease protein
VGIGQKVKIRFSNGIEKEYKVKGIVGSQGFGIVSQTVYMTKKEAERVLGIEDKASSILIKLIDRDNAANYKKFILDVGVPNANVQTWAEASTFAEGINQTFGIVIVVTTFVAVIIVMSTISIVIFINTSRKKRIIGVLKAIGMQNNHIMIVFLAESMIFGIISTVVGMALVYTSVFYMNANPIHLPVGDMRPVLETETAINAALILIISSLVAGYIPARMAAKQEILEMIRVVE